MQSYNMNVSEPRRCIGGGSCLQYSTDMSSIVMYYNHVGVRAAQHERLSDDEERQLTHHTTATTTTTTTSHQHLPTTTTSTTHAATAAATAHDDVTGHPGRHVLYDLRETDYDASTSALQDARSSGARDA